MFGNIDYLYGFVVIKLKKVVFLILNKDFDEGIFFEV